jgi:4-hydroxy-3-methylbut-2-enyl diphosphate reductase
LANEIRAEWFVNAETVGITAGTSTPDSIIDAVEKRIEEIAARRVASGRLVNAA